MSSNPFLDFSREELESFKPFIDKLKKKYNIHGIELDFHRVYDGKHEYLVCAHYWHKKLLREAERHPALKTTTLGWINNALSCILDYLDENQSSASRREKKNE